MSKTGQKIIDRLSALPEGEREAVEHGVLRYIDWLSDMRAELAEAEADIAAGRVKPADEVFDRLLAKYAVLEAVKSNPVTVKSGWVT